MPAIAHQNKILGNGALVDDTTTSADKTWSSSKINTELGLKANSADVPLKTQITNPNLLDNPWFTINQRGVSSYTGNRYSVDRWKSSSANSVVTVNSDNSVTLSKVSTGNAYLVQYLEDSVAEKLAGRTVTLSINVKAVVGSLIGIRIRYGDSSDAYIEQLSRSNLPTGISFNTGVVPNTTKKIRLEIFDATTTDSSASITVESVKLELGSISTLALDTAPNYATELLKCQRYYQRWSFPQYYTIGAVSASDSWIVLFVPSQKMRVLPTVVTTGTWYTVVNDTVPAYATSLGAGESVGGYNLGGARTTTGANTSGYAYAADAGGFVLELIADL